MWMVLIGWLLHCFDSCFIMWYGRGKLAHFRRGELAHLFSMDKNNPESTQYLIAILDFISTTTDNSKAVVPMLFLFCVAL